MDGGLVRAAREGSQAAFSRLVERHQAPLRGFLRRAHGWAEADDIAQEALVTAWSSLHRLRDDAGFRPWLFGIAWKKAQTAARSARRSAVRDNDWAATEVQTAADGVAPEERLALEAALAQLSPEQRAAVTLCLAEGWSHGEAAEALGLPLGTVKSHVARGRDRLLASLGERT
ncbi:RNA polymerase sigma factor [Caulobacter sp. NIBR1757]|uniref:RNA polymerase sigma factor n=1 Tax=Caulobacter sp. NIBR1757 TaxID=3016000 RepID=UPI0022F00A8D|nr:RNA polymerase sigma factor [Caulobacter sp. NIBR1757]WGM39895.1 ECF RNA polymerase sigma factor SigW [Caulobacter sp. NIBR1757]